MTFEDELREIVEDEHLSTKTKVELIRAAAADFYMPGDAEMWDR
jgi:predicted nuclease with RNAse H fold